MGFAVPASLGAQMARPKLRPLVLVGDGAFQMTGMELSSIVRQRLNPVVIVLNNAGYGTERHIHDGPFNDLLTWNYHKLPEFLGAGRAFLVETEAQLDAALDAAVVQQYEWVLYIFAAFLVFTGIKMFFTSDHDPDIGNNPVVRWISRHMRVTKELHDQHFFVKVPDGKTGKMVNAATPLFLALVVINLADLVFAVDSVPAIFAITTDTFVVYTSNIMAILGLRSLYFMLAGALAEFDYLKYALAGLLVFIGAKMIGHGHVHISNVVSLAVIAGFIGTGVIASIIANRRKDAAAATAGPAGSDSPAEPPGS